MLLRNSHAWKTSKSLIVRFKTSRLDEPNQEAESPNKAIDCRILYLKGVNLCVDAPPSASSRKYAHFS
jgi:hypothetical protein